MLLGFAIGMIRLLDVFIPNHQQAVEWLHFVPKFLVGIVGWAFIIIFIGVLPLIAKNIIESHKAKNRILGRDDWLFNLSRQNFQKSVFFTQI